MARIIVAIFRMMPLEILIGIIAVIGYLILSEKKGSSVAKEFFIKLVLYVNAFFSIALIIITLYAILDNNLAVIELSGACLALCLIAYFIALICKRIFLKNRPRYPWKRIDFKKFFKKKSEE